jgi:hypothetical protein
MNRSGPTAAPGRQRFDPHQSRTETGLVRGALFLVRNGADSERARDLLRLALKRYAAWLAEFNQQVQEMRQQYDRNSSHGRLPKAPTVH